ncbi:exonuclease V [Rostrohypoxylon terebratum]|nr:exonuclease V [Rostrohypoxylon terebratum]
MATSITSVPILGESDLDGSDYGSDFSVGEEVIVNKLLQDIRNKASSPSETTSAFPSSVQSNSPTDTNVKFPVNPHVLLPHEPRDQYHESDRRHREMAALPNKANPPPSSRGQCNDDPNRPSNANISSPLHLLSDDVRYPDLSRVLSGTNPGIAPPLETLKTLKTLKTPETPEPPKDLQSPLQRFRSFPRKPLSVSDLSSGAWCELQYWYTLTRLPGGRKTRTDAMRGGSRVHQTLEDQVHTTVQVNIANKEEAFALRLWNVIQGLRTLRDAGMTRELEVWGVIEGQIVNGVIDQISHQSPNPAFEQELSLSQPSKGLAESHLKYQSAIIDYLEPQHKTFYLTDVKTRASERLPTGAALRPARVQLFLYHRLLSEMASGLADFDAILDRYGLRAEALFSDAFMAQVGDLHDEIFYDADSDFGVALSTPRSPRSVQGSASSVRSHETMPPTELIRYRSIAHMLPLLQSELRETFPRGASSLGELLAVQYRHRDDGRILGDNAFPNDPEALDVYLKQNLEWWRGEREAEGVSIEETYKCRSCEFADDCQWRRDKETAILRKTKSALRTKS